MARSKTELHRECERVNRLLLEDAIRLQLGTTISLARLAEAKSNNKDEFSTWATLEFQEYVRRKLNDRDSVSANAMIYGGSRMLKLSPVTTKRYMGTLRSEGGPFGGLGDIVTFNPGYKSVEDDDYWKDTGEMVSDPDRKPS